jgi:hypothetical protein
MCPVVSYVTNTNLLAGTAVDSSFVYWASHGTGGSILRALVGGGAGSTYYADNLATVLATDGTRLVWLDVNTTISSRLLTGGTVTQLLSTSGILTMSVAAGYVYYGTSGGVVGRVIVDGSSGPTTITSIASPRAVVADANAVYVVALNGDVSTAPPTGVNVIASTIATGATTEVLALDATNVYWITTQGDVVAHARGSSLQTTLATLQSIASNLVTDGTALYWAGTDGTIRELPVSGGTPIVLASSQGKVGSIAIDATSVYWTAPNEVSSTSK